MNSESTIDTIRRELQAGELLRRIALENRVQVLEQAIDTALRDRGHLSDATIELLRNVLIDRKAST